MTLLALLTGLALLVADQVVKAWTVCTFAAPIAGNTTPDDPLPFLPGLVELTRLHNTGSAWGSFSGMRWLLVGFTSLLLLALAVLLWKKIVRHPTGVWAIALFLSGGLGNLIDRIRLGYVVDTFHFQFIDFPVFNVADICVTAGIVLAIIYFFWFMKLDEKKEQNHGEDPAAGK